MSLSDAELRRQLKTYGVNPGPIIDSTRGIYQIRLEKLKNERKGSSSPITKDGRSSSTPVKLETNRSRKRSKSPVLRTTRSNRNLTKLAGYSTDEDDNKESTGKSPEVRPSQSRAGKKDSRKSVSITKDLRTIGSSPSRKSLSWTPKGTRSPLRFMKTNYTPKQPAAKYSDDSDDASERSSLDSYVEMESTETNTTPSLQGRQKAADLRLQKIRDEIKAWKREEDVKHSKSSPKKSGSNGISASPIVARENDVGGSEARGSHWPLSCSSFLPIGTCVFFVVLGLLYATMRYDTALNTRESIAFTSSTNENAKFRALVARLHDFVVTDAGDRICGYKSDEGMMKVSTLYNSLKIALGPDKHDFIGACRIFVENDYGIDFYDEHNDRIVDVTRCRDAYYVKSESAVLSGWCRFTRAVQKVFLRIVFTAAAGVAVWLGLVYRKFLSQKRKEEREKMFVVVQKIIDVLRRQYELSESTESVPPYLPILHVRDMIIPPKDRKKMGKIWDRAKHFLSASETRIRVENQTVQGEDFLVWRWIQASSPSKRHTATSRLWQGEAFDVTKGPMICPTPCLKIRNVFNPTEEKDKNWIEQIQDSILEKCQGNNEILRICVEKDSKEGLVYMLCATNEAAGRAFQALHSAWFDGRLITVKFIRLHRFHHRFPESVNQSNVPLQPTSDVPVSTILASPGAGSQFGRLYPTLPDD